MSILKVVCEHDIPSTLIINFDHLRYLTPHLENTPSTLKVLRTFQSKELMTNARLQPHLQCRSWRFLTDTTNLHKENQKMPFKFDLWFPTWFHRDIHEKPLVQYGESCWAFWKSHFFILSENQRQTSLFQRASKSLFFDVHKYLSLKSPFSLRLLLINNCYYSNWAI